MALSRTDEETRDHVLTGFGELLEWRLVHFVGSRKLSNICDVCNVLARIVKVTLCSHFFCELCYQTILTRRLKCPIDNKDIVHEKVVVIELEKDHLDDYSARCFYFSRGCRYWGPLSLVKRHFLDGCALVHAKCSQCNRRFPRYRAVEHRAECKFGFLQAAIEAIEATNTDSSADDLLAQLAEQEGGGGEGAEEAGAAAGSGDAALTAPAPNRYNLDKMHRRKPKSVRRRSDSSDGARCLVWEAGPTSPSDSGDELSPVLEGIPSLPPATGGAQALPSAVGQIPPPRPTTLDIRAARQTPRLTVEGIRMLSGGFVTGLACSKPWPGPTGATAQYAEPVGRILPSPPLETVPSNLHGRVSSLVDFVTAFRSGASRLPSVLPEELMSAAVASECPDLLYVAPPGAGVAAGQTESPLTYAKNTEALAREESEQEEDVLTGKAFKGAREHETSPGGNGTECSARAVEVPPCTAYALSEDISADSGECGQPEAGASGADPCALQASSVPPISPEDATTASATGESQEQPSGHEGACGIQKNVHAPPEKVGEDVEEAMRELAVRAPGVVPDLTTPIGANVFRCFADVGGVRNTLGRSDRLLIRCEGTVSGYAFELYCLLQRRGEPISLSLEFSFTSGDFDTICQGPPSREVVLRLAHPSDGSRNVRYPLMLSPPEGDGACREPKRYASNPSFFTPEHSWADIEAGGFVSDGILRVDVSLNDCSFP